MPRKGAVSKREILPDPKYHDRLVSKFVNSMMEDGKRSVAERLLYHALDVVGERGKEEPLGLFRKAVENVKPFGAPETLLDAATGAPMVTYTVHALSPSSDAGLPPES